MTRVIQSEDDKNDAENHIPSLFPPKNMFSALRLEVSQLANGWVLKVVITQ